jgi:hypothetical protein
MSAPNKRVQRTRSSPSARHSPLTRRPLGGLVFSLALSAQALAPLALRAEEPIVEAERLVYCGPGWKTTIYASGFAHQGVLDTCQDVDRSQLIRLTKQQIETLEGAIARTHFCDLPEQIKKPESNLVSTEHFDHLVVTVRRKGSKCRVGGGTDDLANPADEAGAKRFMQVWSAITALAPEPPE